MKNSQIEKWTLQIIERVEARQPLEDSRVELKAQWPQDFAKAARRIAGQANAARGEHILWLIGIDEKSGISGADYQETTIWFAGIAAQFDGIAPRCFDLNVPSNDQKIVVALAFETDRAPYVIKNPHFGNRKDDPIAYEVPWRDGTKIRSATRLDLMLLYSNIGLLQSLFTELEYNAIVVKRSEREQSQFRTIEFDKAISENTFVSLDDDLKKIIFSAYAVISNAQSWKKTLENCTHIIERDGLYAASELNRSRTNAEKEIEIALKALGSFLGKTK